MSDLKSTHLFEIHINAEGDKLCLARPSNDDSGAYRIAGPKAWGGSRMVGDIEIRESDLVTYIKDYAPHLAPLIASNLTEQLQQRIAELEAKTSCCMGVGNGNGRLFIYGDHASIKAAQRYVLERDELSATVERLRDSLDELQDNSVGVIGLHMNGDIATWGSLRQGGHFESWLIAFDETPAANLNHVKRDCLLILARDLSSTGEIESNVIECIEIYANSKYPTGE